MSRRLRVASDVAPGSPMPRPGLPGPPAGLPDYSGGHAGTGKMLTLSPSPVKREQSPRVLAARNNASTSFAKSLYGPQFWRTWEKEAVVGSDMAMSRVIADDHEEQRRRARRARKKGGLFESPTKTGVRRLGAAPFGDSQRWPDDRGLKTELRESLPDLMKPNVKNMSLAFAPRDDGDKVFISEKHARKGLETSTASLPGQLSAIGSQPDARHKTAPAYTLRGGPFREAALSYSTVGPGPVYHPSVPSSGLGGAFPKAGRSDVAEPGAIGRPGPKYDTRRPFDGPSAIFPRAKRSPDQPGASPYEAVEVDPVLSAPKGFGYGCSVDEHVKYGQCLDGLCCTRGTWEVAARRKAKLQAKATLKRSATADGSVLAVHKPSAASTAVSFESSVKASDGRASDAVSEGGSSWASEEALPDEFSLSAIMSKTMASASTASLQTGANSTVAGKQVGQKREPPILSIPADTETPFACFPTNCVYCHRPVALRSPIRRMIATNTKILKEFRALAESAVGKPNDDILNGRVKLPKRMPSYKGSPPILFMPGCGYFCAQPCLKTYILSMASPEVAKVTMNRNTRRVALIHATKAKEIDKISQLLVSAAHINLTDSDGNTPLHIACEAGDPNIVERLLHGSFNVLTYTHCLAHHHTACRCFNQKPNLNKRNKLGWTPLHTAAASGRQGIVEKLVAAGADSQAEDFKGHAPQDVAGNQDCYAMLRLSSVYVQDADRLRARTLRAEDLGRTLGHTGASLLSSSFGDHDDE